MYPEFVPIYVELGIALFGIAVIIALQIVILVRGKGREKNQPHSAFQSENGVVFCKKCAEKYSASLSVCPKCKTPRW